MNNEKVLFTNSLGTVTSKRVMLVTKDGSEDIAISDINAIAFERKRNMLLVGVYATMSAIALLLALNSPDFTVRGIAFIFLIISAILTYAYYLGNYEIRLNISGKEQKPFVIQLYKTVQGSALAEAIRKQVLS